MDVTFTEYQLEKKAAEAGEELAQVEDEDC
jgi:hypothetical protein